jgi:DNA helicase-2/ATP-dependent DNA helicase PcrA
LQKIIEKTEYLQTGCNLELFNHLFEKARNIKLNDFVDFVGLHMNTDEIADCNAVSLINLSNIRGLEYPVVFITGFEDGLIPHFNAIKNAENLLEERKLLYHGMTRAKDILIITGARKRRLYTTHQVQEPSRFINELPQRCCQITEKKPFKISFSNMLETKEQSQIPSFSNGTRVKHPTWGMGVVRECYNDENDTKVMVKFSTVGIKKLSLRYANLQKI